MPSSNEQQVEHAEVVNPNEPDGAQGETGEAVEQPAKVMRIGSMIKLLLEEVRQSELDEASRDRLREIYETSVTELAGALSPDLRDELGRLAHPFKDSAAPSEAELRGLARGPVPRHPGHAVRPADGRPAAARRDAPPAPARRPPARRRERRPPGYLPLTDLTGPTGLTYRTSPRLGTGWRRR